MPVSHAKVTETIISRKDVDNCIFHVVAREVVSEFDKRDQDRTQSKDDKDMATSKKGLKVNLRAISH